jgi:hypothetical protein
MTNEEFHWLMSSIRGAVEECEAPVGRSDGEWHVYLPSDHAGEPSWRGRSEAAGWNWIWQRAAVAAKEIIDRSGK